MDESGFISLMLLICVACATVYRSYFITVRWALRTLPLISTTAANATDAMLESEKLLCLAEHNFITSVIIGYRSLLRLVGLTILLNFTAILVLPDMANATVWMIFSVGLGAMNAFVISTFIFCLKFNTTIKTIYLKHNKTN